MEGLKEFYMKKYDIDKAFDDETTRIKTLIASSWINGKKKILIVGCGPCLEGRHLKQKGHYIVGVDINPSMKKYARKNCDEFYAFDLTKKIKIKNESFDVIIAFEIIEHLGFVDTFLDEMNRLLKKDGLLIISTPSESYWKNRFMLFFGRDILSDSHIRLFTPKSLKKKLESYSFVVEKMRGIGKLGFMLSHTFPILSLCGDFIVKARKVGTRP